MKLLFSRGRQRTKSHATRNLTAVGPSPISSVFGHGCRLWLATSLAGLRLVAQVHTAKAELPYFDFKTIADAASWYSVSVVSLTPTPQGLVIEFGGAGSYLLSPALDFTTTQPLWLHLRLKSDQGGIARVSCFKNEFYESDKVEADVPAGIWSEVKMALPSLPGRRQLRLDLPGNSGRCILDRLWFEERLPTAPPVGAPLPPEIGPGALTIRSGDLELTHEPANAGRFRDQSRWPHNVCGPDAAHSLVHAGRRSAKLEFR